MLIVPLGTAIKRCPDDTSSNKCLHVDPSKVTSQASAPVQVLQEIEETAFPSRFPMASRWFPAHEQQVLVNYRATLLNERH